jgi:predicted MPP superfamily phosphohydrolase
MKLAARAFGALSIGALALAVWALWLEPASLRKEDHDIRLAAWPSECEGLRIAILADLHVGSPHNGIANLRRVVALTQESEPDLVLLAGDLVNVLQLAISWRLAGTCS